MKWQVTSTPNERLGRRSGMQLMKGCGYDGVRCKFGEATLAKLVAEVPKE